MYTEAFLKAEEEDFPGGPLVERLPSKAGGADLISAWGSKIPPAMEQLSLHAQFLKSMHSRVPVPQLEIPGTTTKDPA